MESMKRKRLPRKAVAERYCVSTRSIDRWIGDDTLGFPAPIVINGRKFFAEEDLDAFDRECVRSAADSRKVA